MAGYHGPVRVRLILALALVLCLPAAPAAAAEQDFGLRFSANMPGRITFAANGSLTCPLADSRCAEAQAGGALNNNSFLARYVDIDASDATFSSSSANLRIPLGSVVRFAGLYWGGDGGEATAGEPVLLRAPGAEGYSEVRARASWGVPPRHYAAFADVTALVAQAGTGHYTVGNVRGNAGQLDAYAGWALVVAYSDATQPTRNQTVFDGYVPVRFGGGGRQATINVSGFLTPLEGTVRTRVGVVAFEGDRGAYGDTLTFNGRAVSDAQNAANNVFNSSISTNNVAQSTRDPAHPNLLGFDADLFQLDGFLPNGARSTSLVAATTNDNYYLTTVTLATDLYAPALVLTKAVTDINGGQVEPGDLLEYAVTVRNAGTDAATATQVVDEVPVNTDLVAGSAAAVNGRVAAGGRTVTANLGTGATAAAGGRLAVGESASFSFRVRVQRSAPETIEIRNVAVATATGATLGEPISFYSNTIVSVVGAGSFSVGGATDPAEEALAATGAPGGVAAPRLELSLGRHAARVRPGRLVRIPVRVDNTGAGAATSVKACVRIPTGLAVADRGGGTVTKGRICWTRAVLTAGEGLATSFTVQAERRTTAMTVGLGASVTAANATARRASTDLRVLAAPAVASAVVG